MEPKTGDLFFLWEVFVERSQNWQRRKNREEECVNRSKCWTVHSWVGRIILVNITLV